LRSATGLLKRQIGGKDDAPGRVVEDNSRVRIDGYCRLGETIEATQIAFALLQLGRLPQRFHDRLQPVDPDIDSLCRRVCRRLELLQILRVRLQGVAHDYEDCEGQHRQDGGADQDDQAAYYCLRPSGSTTVHG
jgi:hypothetical protein